MEKARLRYLPEEDLIIVEEVEKNPYNISEACRKAEIRINKEIPHRKGFRNARNLQFRWTYNLRTKKEIFNLKDKPNVKNIKKVKESPNSERLELIQDLVSKLSIEEKRILIHDLVDNI